MNNRRVISEHEHVIALKNTSEEGGVPHMVRHKIVDRTVRMLPEMVIINGQVWYDYTDIMHRAFETGQQAYIRRRVM